MEQQPDTKLKNEEIEEENEHAKAIAFVEEHRDFFEHYAKGAIRIEPAPKGLNTFAFDLENNTIYINAKLFEKFFGLVEQKVVFATLHEIEHFLEKIQVLSEDGGEKKFNEFLQKIKKSKAFSLMDNCVADVRENRTVVAKTNQGMKDLEEKIYKEDLFKNIDFTSKPRHIQFCEAFLRESRVPEEKCQVSPEVREALDRVAKIENLVDVMTNPETPMSLRWRLQDKYIWSIVKKLREKDLEDKKKQKEDEKNEKDSKERGDNNQKQENQNQEQGDKNEDGKYNQGEKEKNKNNEGGDQEPDLDDPDESDFNKIFSSEYKEVEDKFPEAVPLEEIEKAFKEWQEFQKGKSGQYKIDEEYAKNIGVEKKYLQQYRKIVEQLEKNVNQETGLNLIEELEDLITKIVAKRLKKAHAPKYPVEEGDELVDPAQIVADAKAFNFESKSWEDTEIKEKKGDKFGEIEITLVFDKSYSMNEPEAKRIEQRKAGVLFMEVLKKFTDVCEENKVNMEKPLEVRSEIYAFEQDEKKDKKPLKKMDKEITEKERIDIMIEVSTTPGGTTDFIPLETINSDISENDLKKIKEGELKKIVIVFTDGESNDVERTKKVLRFLREKGIVAIGVGITESGRAALDTYAPDTKLAKKAEDLVEVLAEILKEHLKLL